MTLYFDTHLSQPQLTGLVLWVRYSRWQHLPERRGLGLVSVGLLEQPAHTAQDAGLHAPQSLAKASPHRQRVRHGVDRCRRRGGRRAVVLSKSTKRIGRHPSARSPPPGRLR